MKYRIWLVWLLLVAVACQEQTVTSNTREEPAPNQGLVGKWLLCEYGYSPGGGYEVKPVPKVPPQTLEFTADGKLRAQGEQLTAYQNTPNYRIDSSANGLQLALLKKDAQEEPVYEYVQVRADSLRLSSPRCIEGCHLGFVRVNQ